MGTSSASKNHLPLASPPPTPPPRAHTKGRGGGGLASVEEVGPGAWVLVFRDGHECEKFMRRIEAQNHSLRADLLTAPGAKGGAEGREGEA